MAVDRLQACHVQAKKKVQAIFSATQVDGSEMGEIPSDFHVLYIPGIIQEVKVMGFIMGSWWPTPTGPHFYMPKAGASLDVACRGDGSAMFRRYEFPEFPSRNIFRNASFELVNIQVSYGFLSFCVAKAENPVV